MRPHMTEKRNSNIRDVKRVAFIKYKLNCIGLKLVDVARDLGISRQAVYRSINGLSKISRVDEWLCEKLGKEVVGG